MLKLNSELAIMGVIQKVDRANANRLGYKIVIWLNETLFFGKNKASLLDLNLTLRSCSPTLPITDLKSTSLRLNWQKARDRDKLLSSEV